MRSLFLARHHPSGHPGQLHIFAPGLIHRQRRGHGCARGYHRRRVRGPIRDQLSRPRHPLAPLATTDASHYSVARGWQRCAARCLKLLGPQPAPAVRHRLRHAPERRRGHQVDALRAEQARGHLPRPEHGPALSPDHERVRAPGAGADRPGREGGARRAGLGVFCPNALDAAISESG